MAGIRELKRSTVAFKLNAGRSETTGKDVIKSVNLPGVVGSPDPNDIMSISEVLSPCFEYEVQRIEHTRVDIITEG